MARRPLSIMLFGALGIWSSQAHAAGDSTAPAQQIAGTSEVQQVAARSTASQAALLEPVTVTATRTASAVSRTAASISVITEQDLEETQADTVKEALRYEPGVTVRRTAYRPTSAAQGGGRDGDSSINIRGLEGNRILMMEDGIRMPSSFSFGPLEAGRGDYADLSTLQRIEILRGPASALYGSDGLTGAVNFITKNPRDLLEIYGKPTYFSARAGYDSSDRSVGGTLTAAGGNDLVQGMLIVDGRLGHETDNNGSNNSAGPLRTTANPQNTYSESLLGKIVVTPTPYDTFKFTVETVRQRVDTNVLSAIKPPTTLALEAHDRMERNRYSVDYDFKNEAARYFQTAHVQFFYQDASQDQSSFEVRGNAPSRSRLGTYSERMIGGSAFAESGFTTGILKHKLLYGADGSVDHISALRNGAVPGVGEQPFPNKPFPDTDYTLMGAFVQDQISYGALSVTPGLRFDTYKLSAKSGDLQYAGTPVSSSDNALSPRIAVLYEVSSALIPYAQYAHGFRAPSPDQVNNAFANPVYGYTSIGNPNLKPETSDTIEIGLRGKLGTGFGPLRYSAAAFTGRYNDFIAQQTIGGTGTATDPLVFQYVNFSKAYIHGLEGRAEWFLPHGFSVKTAMAFTKGSVDSSNVASQPLDSINPFSAVFGIRYEPSERWFAQADLLYQASKKSSDIGTKSCTPGPCFAPPSSFVVDLRAGYRFNKHVIAYFGVLNLFDRQYWNWSDVRGIAETSPIKDAYTAPGRSFSVSMKIDF
ncbi:TonB-dependent hemoglobin/transferrin/lactoferrin family receptor [Paraburkholderia bonniea]|uniref:TonB-dependent hemoglobin/transferrin/lactoferrin family receptor n=1 Tax=Paraburkholderia bonniea TaxID=2152891 RepID=UPI0025722DE9|nr:TonB-dependent hemoglobin/transferrin/lactoferrin family receptor [Paraburkholderia bonniea]WJF92183.1 TonB-dependent hemoglobin/transferrin/lactoferrin family receptor [Paraburkholderia bonniea]WJF95502.1 TonB-dependent hemoglobin/transferrin/lactoferrin family receptor [Paraburkholderia bonniea]